MEGNAITKSLDLLKAQLHVIDEKVNSILDKVHPHTESKKYLVDQDLLEEFHITRAIKEKLIAKGILRPIKLNGSRSTSLYIREEVENALEENGRTYQK